MWHSARCRSLEGLKFLNPLRKYDVIVSKGAAEFSKNFNDRTAAENALNKAKAHNLSLKAKKSFEECRMEDAVEEVWEVNNLTSALAVKSVRRLVSKSLNVIKALKDKIKKQDKMLRKLSSEFVELGEMTISDGKDYKSALLNFEKAIQLNPDNKDAEFGIAKCLLETGSEEEGCKILGKIMKTKGKHYYEACLLKGDYQAKRGDLGSAALNYQAAAKYRPYDRIPILRLIELYEKAGMEESADIWRGYLDDCD